MSEKTTESAHGEGVTPESAKFAFRATADHDIICPKIPRPDGHRVSNV